MNIDFEKMSTQELTDFLETTEKALKEEEEAIIKMEETAAEMEARNDFLTDLLMRGDSISENSEEDLNNGK